MSSIAEIEEAIARLSRAEFLRLVDHLRERYADEWDRQIEEDTKAGRLDALWSEAEKD